MIKGNVGFAGIKLLLVEIVLDPIHLEIDLITILIEKSRLRGMFKRILRNLPEFGEMGSLDIKS